MKKEDHGRTRQSIASAHEPWLFRHFQKDKLRVRERYWRYLPPKLSDFRNCEYVIIPHGPTWRKYLALVAHLIEDQQQQQRTSTDAEPPAQLQWVLLESAVELLDYNNVSPSVERPIGTGDGETFRVRESAAPRERNKLFRLLENQSTPMVLYPFCDLSFREPEFDEWEFLRYSSMSIPERSRHALARAGRMIHGQAQPNQQVIVIVDDEDERINLQSQAGDELLVVDMEGFLDLMSQQNLLVHPEKVDKLSQLKLHCEEDYRRRNETPINSNNNDNSSNAVHEYLSEGEIQQGLRNGDFVRGKLEVTKENPKEGFVTSGDMRYFVNQRVEHFNRAFHGDAVILKKLPESEWGRPVGRRKLVHNTDEDGEELVMDDDIPVVPSGRVVAIAAPSSRNQYVATLVDIPFQDENAVLLVPMDIRVPKIRVVTKSWKKFINQRLLAESDGWEMGSNYPHGRCLEILGPIGNLEVEIKCLLIENQVMLDPFSAAAVACLPPEGAGWNIPDKEIYSRRDLRQNRRVFSVDPPGCQDIDDAMHAHVLPNGDIEVGVHIADVTFFVPHRSPLDKEARKRGTTFYLVDRRFDMLPSLLSSDLCSLHGDVDRLAVSVIWTLAPDLETVKDVWYGRTVIHNCQAMTYDQAHNILHDKPPDDPNKPAPPPLTAGYRVDPTRVPGLTKDLTILRDLGRKLKRRREDLGGAVDLSSGDMGGELKFQLDENGNPVAVKPKKELEIHNTIAEMMIFANGYVATKIFDCFPNSALLRIHRTVEQARFQDLKDVLDVGGVSLEANSNMALANTLKKVEKAGSVVNSLIKSLATRAMSEAQYVCTGDREDGLDLSHYGLGVDHYTHFTSPIRRYADCVVHKQLLAALYKDKSIEEGNEADLIPAAFADPERPALTSIPDSNVISIMGGEGLEPVDDAPNDEDDNLDDLLDSLIEGASEMALGGHQGKSGDETDRGESGVLGGECDEPKTPSTDESAIAQNEDQKLRPYVGSEVSGIADSLNRQNRMAKYSAMECQKLFLSLYFRDHAETAQGVVTNLRVNGFFVYIPEYDISGPVFLRDTNGDVQIDPSFLGLPPSAGQPPTLGFASSNTCRRFPNGVCKLIESTDGSAGGSRLEVSVPEGKQVFTVRTVDALTVSLRCDDWDVRSRVPPPRFQLKSKGSRPPPGFGQVTASKKITTKVLQEQGDSRNHSVVADSPQKNKGKPFPSLFDALQAMETLQPVLVDAPIRSSKNQNSKTADIARTEDFKGRIVYGNFVNPDTKSATQEAAITAASQAAAQRRANAIETDRRRNEYDSSRNIERDIMARTQRLAAEKRNARQKKSR